MKKYAVCGVSARAIGMFIAPIIQKFSQQASLVALLDSDPQRFIFVSESIPECADIPNFNQDEFEKMVNECKPDVIIVAGRDNTHVDYILAALALDLDVISEKPMVTTAADCRRVLDAEAISKGKVTVTFNARYPSIQRKIKELILDDKVGRITSVDLNWYVDTYHGASYFKRWNRMRENSGGLTIHKSTHHLDLVSWLVDQKPVEAFAFSALNYYGDKSEANPSKKNGRHCSSCTEKASCSYYSRWASRSEANIVSDDHLGGIHNEKGVSNYSNYRPDACIFDAEIDIEDTYTATVKFDKGTLLSYSVNFSTPYEGFRLAINGTKGRIETTSFHEGRIPYETPTQTVDYFPLFGAKESIQVLQGLGAHGGSDPLIQEDLFLGPDPLRPYEILAGAEAGSYAVAVGEAIWKSGLSNKPVKIEDLLKGT